MEELHVEENYVQFGELLQSEKQTAGQMNLKETKEVYKVQLYA